MANVSVDSIPKICAPIGGIKSAMFIVSEHPDVILPAINTSQAADEINFNGAENDAIFYVNFRTSSAELNERKLTDSDAGDYFEYILQGWIRKRRKAAVDLVHALMNRTVHCVVTDRNDETTLILYLRHSSDYSSGDRIGSPNGFNFQFRVNTPQISPIYGYALPAPGDPGDGGGDPGGGDPGGEVEELKVHREFITSGDAVSIPNHDHTKLAFRDNLHLVESKDYRGYTDVPGTGITLSEPIRTDNPAGGEWITIVYVESI